MTRFSLITAVLCTAGATAYAESQAEIAAKLNDEGKDALYAINYAQASAKFREAVARVPEPKYFFNLCTSLYSEGKFDEALTACNAVGNNKPAPDLLAKTDKLVGRIKDEAKTQGLELHPAGGGGGNTDLGTNPPPDPNGNPPDPNGNPPPPNNGQPAGPQTVGRAPEQGVFMAVKPDHHYTWSMGVDILGGGGQIGQSDYYGKTFGGIRIKGDYVLNSALRLGAQGYIQFSQFGSNRTDVGTLSIIDTGVAAYKHFCAAGIESLCLTPLLGVQVAAFAPSRDPLSTDGAGSTYYNYIAGGARAELNAEFAFGNRQSV